MISVISPGDPGGAPCDCDSLGRERRECAKANVREKHGGPPHHRIQLRNLEWNYVSAVLNARNDDRITPADASYYMEDEFTRRLTGPAESRVSLADALAANGS